MILHLLPPCQLRLNHGVDGAELPGQLPELLHPASAVAVNNAAAANAAVLFIFFIIKPSIYKIYFVYIIDTMMLGSKIRLHRISGLWSLVSTGSSWKLQAGLSLASVF